jgi:hypothetical protein
MRSRKTERAGETVCLAAILKDEDPFVEEWIAHHRLLGVDHFYLYDNDPRQPLSDLLASHRGYVTIRPWLVDHDDARYPGRTKQIKAYQHCLDHDAVKYDWVTFIDGDEFIILDEDANLKAFLADFREYDLIALNWHVFGHNGHYDNPPGLVIESLTRRMREPRAITKSLSRPGAIASLDVHLCRLKKGGKRVDANKNAYREPLYPGKTRRAHINHYQCRSFTHWMGKVERGEVGAFPEDPESAWRFSHEGCLRQFVMQIASNKNECIDTSALRYAEPIKAYLAALRNEGDVDEHGGRVALEKFPLSAPSAQRPADAESKTASSPHFVPSSIVTVVRQQLTRFRHRLRSAISLRPSSRSRRDAVIVAREASKQCDWTRAEMLWQALLDEWQQRAPATAYRHLVRACRHRGNFGKAEEVVRQGLLRHPKHVGLNVDLAEIAIARRDWREASRCADTIFQMLESTPRQVRDGHILVAFEALLGNREYARTFAALDTVKQRGRASKPLSAIEGFAYLRASRMEEARRHWDQYWQRAQSDRDFAAERHTTRQFFDPQNQAHFPALAATRKATDERICVFTALFDGYDELRPPAYKPPGVDFICFSDRPLAAVGWDVRLVDLRGSPAMKNRRLKILPYERLAEYDCSLYLDSNVVLLGDPSHLYRRWLRGQPFVAWRHPQRSSAFDELEVLLASSRAAPSGIIDQYVFFAEQGVPGYLPMIEANFLWRDHRDAQVRTLMERLWDHLTSHQSWRDQPGLAYLMWKTGILPAVLPDHLGTSRDNEYTRKFAHKKSAANQAPSTPGSSSKRLTWVCRDKFSAVASTLMRGHQLADIARQQLEGKAEFEVVNETRVAEQRNAILILTKGFLKEATLDGLAQLKQQGNIVCADYVDDPERDDLHEAIDVYIAASIRQYIHCTERYPDKLVHLISHHADPRLSGIEGPSSYCNIGYFGEIVNARYASELQGKIDFCLVNTKITDAGWIPRLGHCNVHYAVRNRRPIDGLKPFLKGFTAAHTRSNIIVPKAEGDAIYYLSSDYPYLLEDESLQSVLDMIDRVKASFASDEWHRGLEIMASVRRRSSPEQIGSELATLLTRFG